MPRLQFSAAGAGVLSLSYSIGVLGWFGGMLVMVVFALITWFTSQLLVAVTVVDGVRQRSYMGEQLIWL